LKFTPREDKLAQKRGKGEQPIFKKKRRRKRNFFLLRTEEHAMRSISREKAFGWLG